MGKYAFLRKQVNLGHIVFVLTVQHNVFVIKSSVTKVILESVDININFQNTFQDKTNGNQIRQINFS